MGKMLGIAVAAAALSGMTFGFDTAVVAGVTASLREVYTLDPAALGFAVSSALWGTLAGAAAGAIWGGRVGSRGGLGLAAVFYVIAGIGCGPAPSFAALIAFRMLCGFAIGISSVVAPVYLAEIAPARSRGALVGMF